jgi:uncharacterized small protein (DUF1192 family)
VNRSNTNVERRKNARRSPADRRRGLDRRSADHRGGQVDVTRFEHDELRERIEFLTRRITRLEAESQIQFTRIAQMQAELDALSRRSRVDSSK